MSASTTRTGFAVAAAAAALFAMASAPVLAADAAMGGVQCSGVNSCKGTAECKTASNDCKGMNSCKGHGWVMKKSAEECTKAGGTVNK